MALSRRAETLAFTQGKIVYLKDLSGSSVEFVQIKRDCKLVALAVSDDGLAVATGDEAGKIYHVTNPHGSASLIVQTLHWHASQVNSLAFIRDTPLLISGGTEAVLVQWHLEKQERAFVSRVGEGILNFSLSENYYGLTLADNTVKVVRIDNNKIVMSSKLLHITEQQISSFHKNLVVPSGTKLQVQNLDEEYRGAAIIDVVPRNYISNADV